MKAVLVGTSLILLTTLVVAQDPAPPFVESHSFRFYSAFWPNLHHVLWTEAWARRPPSEEKAAGSLPEPLTADLTEEERLAWEAAIDYYDEEIADLHLLFEMGAIRKALLTAESGDLPSTGLAPAHRKALAAAAAVYRRHWWPAHDRANRAWIADTLPIIASLSPTVPDQTARLSGTPWFSNSLRVDVVRVGSREGAYTSMDPAPGHITVSSSSPHLQSWMAGEIMFHEASHLLFFPIMGEFTAELRAQGKDVRSGPIESWNVNVWHVALFHMTGEIVRQALASRGIAYEPYLEKTGLFDRAWPQFRAPIERYWKAYIQGEISRGDAIRSIVTAIN